MHNRKNDNLNICSEKALLAPVKLKEQYPLGKAALSTVLHGQTTIKNILARNDPRLFMVIGPCSIHDVEAAREYAQRLKKLADEVRETLFLVMRVYFEKPRTRVGWQGLINDPHLDNSGHMEAGLHLARKLLVDLANMGIPVAGEALDVISPQYVQDLYTWTAIGARTAESQTHRRMASGLSSAVGFKNGTDGNLSVAINAMHSAANPANFLSINSAGHVAMIRTKGNSRTHIVVRGGGGHSNYDADSLAACEKLLAEAGFPQNIMVDCSHGNSQGDPSRQENVLKDVTEQIIAGNQSIVGLMLESNLEQGKQSIPKDLSNLRYGVSVTDACIDWKTTERAVRQADERLQDTLLSRRTRKQNSISTTAEPAK